MATMAIDRFRIGIEPAKLLSAAQELAVLREAHRRSPASAMVRRRLAQALLLADRFGEVIALLDGATGCGPDCLPMLILALLARETAQDDRRVVEIVDRSLAEAGRDTARAQWLADRGKACRRLGDGAGARASLERALALDPANRDACKRLAGLDLDAAAPEDAIATLERLAAQGASHARLHAARALAHARAGRIEAAREALGFDALHHAAPIDVAGGADGLARFNAALAAELLDHPDLRYDRYGTASEQTWRIDAPALGEAPMVRQLLAHVARTAERHVERLVGVDHDWLRDRPARAMLHCWSVLTEGSGFESWHVHQFGWMSGVYYVRVPPSVTAGEGSAGCLGFGLPEGVVGETAAARYGMRTVRPAEGLLLLFPSHCYHRTFPHGAAERRICVAFDIRPA